MIAERAVLTAMEGLARAGARDNHLRVIAYRAGLSTGSTLNALKRLVPSGMAQKLPLPRMWRFVSPRHRASNRKTAMKLLRTLQLCEKQGVAALSDPELAHLSEMPQAEIAPTIKWLLRSGRIVARDGGGFETIPARLRKSRAEP